jgi:hypothetical protein
LELGDLRLDPFLALRVGKSWCHMLLGFGGPVFGLVSGLEGGVRADGCIGIGVDLRNFIRTNTIF